MFTEWFYISDTQSFLNFFRILNRLEVGVFARAVKLESIRLFDYFFIVSLLGLISHYSLLDS
jgi:hypothetical protein